MQYVGSRYVPKFMGAYDNTQVYEALCVVDNGMGTSYISKKPTPAGTPLTDTGYWAVYGASSGAIIQLQKEINAIKIIDNVADLVANADLEENDIVYVAGYYNAGDGGDGTFKISSAADGFYHALNNGLYANNIDREYKLPRYGGYYVDDMVDNLRPFLVNHQFAHIILPPPSKNHPGCEYYVENGVNTYFWKAWNPIKYDEHYAYTINEYYGNIVLDKDSPNSKAVFMISDIAKPEDIYFNNLMVEGYHMNGNTNYPNAAILIEGCARFNVQNLGAGYAKNSILIGGSGANNTAEMNFNFCEVGSCTEKAIMCDNPNSSIVRINTLQIQNILTGCEYGIYATNGSYKWRIGEMSVAIGSGQTITNFTPVYWNTSASIPDLGFNIGRLRAGGAGTGHLILVEGYRSINRVGVVKSPSNADSIINNGLQAVLLIDDVDLQAYTNTLTVETTQNYAVINIKRCGCSVSQSGKNITIAGINAGNGFDITELFGVYFDTGTNELKIRYNGTTYPAV